MQPRGAPICLLEDDPNDRFFVHHALQAAHIINPIVWFETAEEARRHFNEGHRPVLPVLCVFDVHLPGGETGIDFLRWLRAQLGPLGTTPVMMLSGSDSPHDRDQAELLGSIYFLKKPVTEARLTAAVQALGFVVTTLTGFATERIIERRE